ncbi:MAG TPA: xanthine dehydrogenase family protein molybdopterin-binding subunit [Xanthobacteraceae bacterium]|jgi:carbon-monoxide dehydrogenase large subunit|nr:xanthine dehydrogenase family protein molybdopterin-binding subunit [Xanthobacteraceae bacterium]
MGEFAIGQPVPRFEDPRLIQGHGRYIADMTFPGMAHGVVLRSPHAHARIRSIDTSKAKAAPGVLAVLTGADYKAAGFGDLPVPGGLKRRDGAPGYRPRYPALVEDRVRMIGDYVAFVVAENLYQAIDASELIEVDYEPLPAAVSTGEALKPGVPLVWDDCANNIGFIQIEGNKDATDSAFARAAHVVKHDFVINRVTAAAMEPRGCIGLFEPIEGRYTIYTTLQRTNVFQTELSQYVLKVPDSKIRVVCGDIGGSFGMKSAVYNEVALVLCAAKVTGRPVKWVATRSESFVCDAQARDNVTTAELALDRDGNFLGFRAKIIAAIGAYMQTGMPAFTGNLGTLAGVYRTPASHIDVTAVFTHTQPVRPYRGNGRPEAGYIIERMVDLAADQIGMDPAELRKRNTIPASAMPFKTSVTFTYDCGEFEKNLDLALEAADKKGFEKRRAEAKKHGKLRGLGFSNTIERSAAAGLEGAEIRFDRTGSVSIFSGSINQGQGHETAFKQVVCDRLGLDPKEVTYIQGDTDQVFFAEGTGGSRSAAFSGSAFTLAAEKVEAKGKAIAAKMLKVDLADINFHEGLFSSPKTNRTLTIKEVAKASLDPKNLPDGMEPGLIEKAIYSGSVAAYPNGVHVCELEIDEETGTVEIVNYNVVDDVGTVINPLLLHGQIDGGIAQGVGQILMEDIKFDTEGQILTGSFMDYAMPRASDLTAFHVESNPVPTKSNPLGVKGAGEAGCVGAMPAVANALVDALSVLGIKHVEMPATPEVLWRAIHEARAKDA